MKEIFDQPDLKGENPYDFLLQVFTGDPTRQDAPFWWRNEPFLINETVISTNSEALLFFNKSLSAKEYKTLTGNDREGVKGFLSLEQNELFNFGADILKTALEHCHIMDDCDELPCAGCAEKDYSENSNFFCEHCWGTGIMEVENGKQIYDLSCAIVLKGVPFYALKILMLYKTALVLGIETIEYIQSGGKTGPHYFKVGDVTVLLMPMMANDTEEKPVYEIS